MSPSSLDSQRRIADIVMLMRRCPQPIIALIQGAAAGGGFALALAVRHPHRDEESRG